MQLPGDNRIEEALGEETIEEENTERMDLGRIGKDPSLETWPGLDTMEAVNKPPLTFWCSSGTLIKLFH